MKRQHLSKRFLVSIVTTLYIIVLACLATVASAEPSSGPALWKVEGGNADLYLFGTFHLLPSDLEWETPVIKVALQGAKTLVVEADTSGSEVQTLVQKYAFNAPGKTLASYFTAQEAASIDEALNPWGISIQSAAHLQPWFVGLQVGMTAVLSLGFDPASGVEAVFLKKAAAASMELKYLESAEAGILALADHSDDLQAKLLLAMVDDLLVIEETMDQMVVSWSTGDVENVAEILNGNMARTPELIEAVLYQRNRTWVAPLSQMLESNGSYFVAVGAGHLAGPNSVIELLEGEGYTIVRQ